MKTVKDDTLSFLTQVFLYRGEARMSVGVMAGFTLEERPELLPEQDFLGIMKDSMGKDVIFDPGMPKPDGEFLAAGKCCAPDGRPVQAMLPALRVGPLKKRLAVFGNRRWRQLAGMKTIISEPEPFIEMEMTWKRAFGGPEYESNPEGTGLVGDPRSLPNVELADSLIGAPGDRPAPAGFEPLGMAWPGRLRGLGTFDDSWVRNTWPAYPDDYNFQYYNRAPAGQRMEGWFRGDEPVEADHLHPERAFIRSRLPGLRARCFVVRTANGEEYFAEIEMWLETVWLFPNALAGVLIWRGVTTVADDEASNTPLISAFTEPLDSRPESLEFYLAKVRAMQEGETAPVGAEAPGAPETEEAAAFGLPDIKAPAIPGAGVAASAAGVAGLAVSALAEETPPVQEGAPAAAPADAAGAVTEAPGAGGPPPAGKAPQPLVVHTPDEIPASKVPELPPLEDRFSQTGYEKKAETQMKDILNIPPGQPIVSEAEPLPEMTPEALQVHMESLAAQSEAEARRFFEQHGFDPDAPIEYPPTPSELDRLMSVDPTPENLPPGQLSSFLKERSGMFQQRFDDLAKKHGIDPYSLFPEEKASPYSNAAELADYLKHSGYGNPELIEELQKIDTLHTEADARMDQYLGIIGTSRASLAADAEKRAGEQQAQDAASDAELQEFMKQLAAGTVPGLSGADPPVIPEHPSNSQAESGETPDEDDFEDDPPEAETAPRPEPPAREDVLKRFEGGETLAGAALAGADLSGEDLSNRDFQGTDFSGANLEKANFTNSVLTGAILTGAILTGAIFTGAALAKAFLSTVSASGANFAGVDLSLADLSKGDFTGANFAGANLTGAGLGQAVFNEAKMAGVSLERASALRAEFMGADLAGARLAGMDCTEADFSVAVIEKADFTGATAVSTLFSKARGTGAVFRDANLFNSRADQPADLHGADFTNANLTDARWQDTDYTGARFSGADLSTGLFTRCRFEEADLTGVSAPNADFQKSVFLRARVSGINLFKGSLRKGDLAEADFTGANLYGVDFYQANVVRSRFDGAVLDGTLLAGWRPS